MHTEYSFNIMYYYGIFFFVPLCTLYFFLYNLCVYVVSNNYCMSIFFFGYYFCVVCMLHKKSFMHSIMPCSTCNTREIKDFSWIPWICSFNLQFHRRNMHYAGCRISCVFIQTYMKIFYYVWHIILFNFFI